MATSHGTVKKTPLERVLAAAHRRHHRRRPRATATGWWASTITDGTNEIMLVTSGGKAIRFPEDDVRPMGREAAGVRGITARRRPARSTR